MDDDDLTFTDLSASRRARPFDVLMLGIYLVDELTNAISNVATAAYNLGAMHCNYLNDQATFRREAALEIETMTGEMDG